MCSCLSVDVQSVSVVDSRAVCLCVIDKRVIGLCAVGCAWSWSIGVFGWWSVVAGVWYVVGCVESCVFAMGWCVCGWCAVGWCAVGVCSRLRAVDWRAVVLRVVDWYAIAVWSRMACKQLVWYRLVISRVTRGLVFVGGWREVGRV